MLSKLQIALVAVLVLFVLAWHFNLLEQFGLSPLEWDRDYHVSPNALQAQLARDQWNITNQVD